MCKARRPLTAGMMREMEADGPGHPHIGGDPRTYAPQMMPDCEKAKASRRRQKAAGGAALSREDVLRERRRRERAADEIYEIYAGKANGGRKKLRHS